MKSAKRTSSASPSRRRPAKIRGNCNSCSISPVTVGSQGPSCLTCRAQGLACACRPSSRSATRYAPSAGRKPLQLTSIPDGSFSSSNVSSQHCDLRTHSGSQTIALPPPKHRRSSHAVASTKPIDGAGDTQNSAGSAQNLAHYVTGAEQSNLMCETISDTRACQSNEPAFDVTAPKEVPWSVAADVDVQGHSTSGQGLPVAPGFTDRLDSDIDFEALCGDLTPSAFLVHMLEYASDTAPEQDANPWAQNTDESFAGAGHDFPGFFSQVPKHSLSMKRPHSTLNGIGVCSDHKKTCIISALKILQELHIPTRACLCACNEASMPSRRQPRMMDFVLSTNREVVELVSDMLKCTCSSSSQVQLLLTIICGKLAAWYLAIIRKDHDTYSNSFVEGSIFNRNIDEGQTERVLRQPIAVGQYSLDVELESKIRAQVVECELQHLEVLVENLSRRIQEANLGKACVAARSGDFLAADPEPPSPHDTDLAEATHRSLSTSLHKQLQAAKAEIIFVRSDKHDLARVSRESRNLAG